MELSLIGLVVSEEKMFENFDGQTDDGRMDRRANN